GRAYAPSPSATCEHPASERSAAVQGRLKRCANHQPCRPAASGSHLLGKRFIFLGSHIIGMYDMSMIRHPRLSASLEHELETKLKGPGVSLHRVYSAERAAKLVHGIDISIRVGRQAPGWGRA